jgi:membrane protein YdbS with pleckstrin-like domain
MTLRNRILHWLRVPHDPAPPAGDEDVQIFRAAPNYLRYLYVLWLVKHVFALVGLWWGLQFSGTFIENIPDSIRIGGWLMDYGGRVRALLYALETLAVVGFLTQFLFSLLLVKLDFEQRWYIVTDRSLRVREGLMQLHEKTMTFANVQNVSVRQGPLERILGIANVEVRSAGGGQSESEPGKPHKDDMHVAYFRGVASADSIRSAITERLRAFRDSGLGDPDDVAEVAVTRDDGLLAPALALASEARELKLALTRR